MPEDQHAASTPLSPGFDMPSSVGEQLGWLREAGFLASLAWERGDLAVLVGMLPRG